MITAIIPVRKGSQRVKNKNKKKFANSSLLEIKIKQLLTIYFYLEEKVPKKDSDQGFGLKEWTIKLKLMSFFPIQQM